MVLSPPSREGFVFLIVRVLAAVRLHTWVDFIVLDSPLILNVEFVTIVRDLLSAAHVAVALLSHFDLNSSRAICYKS